MGSLALLARESGHEVSGSDINCYPPISDQLDEMGIEIIPGSSRELPRIFIAITFAALDSAVLPVLPALTAAPASPCFTALTARPMLVVFARRKARLGSSSPPTTSSLCRISEAPAMPGWDSSAALIRVSSPTSRNLNLSWRRRASAAPSTMTRTPSSPPIASTAIRGRLMRILRLC